MTEEKRIPVRAAELARALRILPHPDEPGPDAHRVHVHRFRLTTCARQRAGAETEEVEFITFRREHFAEGRARWREWVLDI